jgi:hypothetical protein
MNDATELHFCSHASSRSLLTLLDGIILEPFLSSHRDDTRNALLSSSLSLLLLLLLLDVRTRCSIISVFQQHLPSCSRALCTEKMRTACMNIDLVSTFTLLFYSQSGRSHNGSVSTTDQCAYPIFLPTNFLACDPATLREL